ncbi:TIGR04222 domain-containing membrane protein [Sphingomonas sp. MMS24-J45]|uniref:TIGR04222 domain-containing membrane protein n=1 Tax=Sphingomonas sp. MMS24-J45 TaxID=3238806 RepID=UPI00384DED85
MLVAARGGTARITDEDQLAYLAGGATRLTDAVVARLLAAGALVLEGKGKFRIVAGTQGETAAERAILTLSSPATLAQLQSAVVGAMPQTKDALIRSGAMIDDGTAWQLRFFQTAPYLLLLLFGAIKWDVGVLRERPVGYLTALLVVTAVFALIRFAVVDRRTRGGVAVLQSAREGSERLRRAPMATETGLAVALFGTMVLSGSAWGDYHRLRASSGGDGSVSSDGGSGCGGDGGGGGCGGCSS